MKQQIYAKLITLMEDNKDDHEALKNLVAKGLILNKGGDTSASVCREILNA